MGNKRKNQSEAVGGQVQKKAKQDTVGNNYSQNKDKIPSKIQKGTINNTTSTGTNAPNPLVTLQEKRKLKKLKSKQMKQLQTQQPIPSSNNDAQQKKINNANHKSNNYITTNKNTKKEEKIKNIPKPELASNIPSINFNVAIPDVEKHAEVQNELEQKMKSAQFRFLNERLYTVTGAEAKEMFDNNPELPELYHTGYRRQAAQWPVNPLHKIVNRINEMKEGTIVADFGCGEAALSKSVPHKVHSFDLYAVNDRVTVCDMSNVPLPDSSVDVVVFCLSLMGTNFKDYVREANRVLRKSGILLIAEVKSRIDSIKAFIEFLQEAGFIYDSCDKRNKMFLWLELHKTNRGFYSSKERAAALLKPCLYKKR